MAVLTCPSLEAAIHQLYQLLLLAPRLLLHQHLVHHRLRRRHLLRPQQHRLLLLLQLTEWENAELLMHGKGRLPWMHGVGTTVLSEIVLLRTVLVGLLQMQQLFANVPLSMPGSDKLIWTIGVNRTASTSLPTARQLTVNVLMLRLQRKPP